MIVKLLHCQQKITLNKNGKVKKIKIKLINKNMTVYFTRIFDNDVFEQEVKILRSSLGNSTLLRQPPTLQIFQHAIAP